MSSKVTSFVMENTYKMLKQAIADSVSFHLIIYRYREVFLKTESQLGPLIFFFYAL